MARRFMRLSFVSLFGAIATSIEFVEGSCDGAACSNSEVENQENDEMFAAKLEMLQMKKQSTMSAKDSHPNVPVTSSHETDEKTREAEDGLVQKDHNGKMCMLCAKPLPERVNKTYTEFRKDCGSRSSPTGPPADVLKMPVAQLARVNGNGVETNGFCELNFAKSCADAVANKDYLYWAKSLDLSAADSRQNAAWDGRYCRLNGFLEASMVSLQHNFDATQTKAKELCRTKYAKYNIDNITFMDMMQLRATMTQALQPKMKRSVWPLGIVQWVTWVATCRCALTPSVRKDQARAFTTNAKVGIL